jgi:phosphate uptake regulator
MARIHTSRDFEAELRELRAHSLAMGARCERSLQLALEAFWSGSPDTARSVARRRSCSATTPSIRRTARSSTR